MGVLQCVSYELTRNSKKKQDTSDAERHLCTASIPIDSLIVSSLGKEDVELWIISQRESPGSSKSVQFPPELDEQESERLLWLSLMLFEDSSARLATPVIIHAANDASTQAHRLSCDLRICHEPAAQVWNSLSDKNHIGWLLRRTSGNAF